MDQETNITLCCPSRGRPDFAKRMQNSAFATAANPENIKVKFYLNKDDPMLKQYDLIDDLIPNNWIRLIGAGNGGYFLVSSKIEQDEINDLSLKNGLKGIFKAKPSNEGLSSYQI